MKFSDKLLGADLNISNNKLNVTRKEGFDPINSSTIAFSIQPLTIKRLQSFILDCNFRLYGFGKIGITSKNPFNTDFSKSHEVQTFCSLDNGNQNQISITEFPLFNMITSNFKNMEISNWKSQEVRIHLLIILNMSGEVHYFLNFQYKGILFTDSFSSVSLWLFFDLSGCLTSISISEYNGAPDPGICWNHASFGTYYNECTRGSLLCHQSNLSIIHTSKLDEVLCEIFDCKNFEEILDSKRIGLKTLCNFETGTFTPQGFTEKINEKSVVESKSYWGYIGQADNVLYRDNSLIELSDNRKSRIFEKIALFEAEKIGFNIFKKLNFKINDNDVKKSSTNELSFTDLSSQLPTSLKEPMEELSCSLGVEQISLVEKLILFFMPNDKVKVNGEKFKDGKKNLCKVEKTYSTEITDEASLVKECEIAVDVTVYRSLIQFQISLAIGIKEPGAHLLTIDIDHFVLNLNELAQIDLNKVLEQWLWILYQRGPDQVGPKSVTIVLCYNRATLDVLSSEKLIPNIQVIKKLATELCNRHDYRMIVNGEPIIFCPSSTNKSEKIDSIKMNIYNSISRSVNVSRLFPKKWIKFANAILELNIQQTKLLSFSQICQMTDDHDCNNVEDLVTILSYLFHLGVIQWVGDKSYQNLDDLVPGHNSNLLKSESSVVITDKHWLLKTIYGLEKDCKNHSNSMNTLETVLKSYSYHRLLFILLLKYPLLAVESDKRNKLWTIFDYPLQPPVELFPISSSDKGVTIYFLFNHPIPWISYVSLLLASSRISSDQDIISFDNSVCSIRVDLEDFHEMVIYRISSMTIAIQVYTEKYSQTKPEILVRVRQFIEQCIYQVASKNLHRFTGHSAVKCPCNSPCSSHNKRKCNLDYSCLHFLNLDEVLCNQAVFCGRRRISTAPWQELFPKGISKKFCDESNDDIIHVKFATNSIWNTESQLGCYLPQWMRTSAKFLSTDNQNFTWKTLAIKLGYSEKIKKFEEDPNPALAMLVDWITTSGNNQLSVDFIILTLQEAGQFQISDIIESDPECQWLQPQIFISYQWHNQREAREISEYLHRVGYTTWMDVGQMGGGDLLMHRIERAIRGCKVLIACISPRYIVSTICHREIVLADLLKKPIIPVMVLPVPWPPPGGTGLMLAPYIYIDLFGVGGHGGTGLKSDLTSRFAEIETQVSKYCSPICVNIESTAMSCMNTISISPEFSSKPSTISTHEPHSHELTISSLHQPSALTNIQMPVASQTSIRECSSICTFI